MTFSGDTSYVPTYGSYILAYMWLLHMVLHTFSQTCQQVSPRMMHS